MTIGKDTDIFQTLQPTKSALRMKVRYDKSFKFRNFVTSELRDNIILTVISS